MRALLLVLAALLAGCASTLTVKVRSDDQTNDGRSMYLVVREADLPTFMTESYGDVEALIEARDPSIYAAQPIHPGRREKVEVTTPEAGAAVYVMFNEPVGSEWKRFYETPRRRAVRLELERSEIQ